MGKGEFSLHLHDCPPSTRAVKFKLHRGSVELVLIKRNSAATHNYSHGLHKIIYGTFATRIEVMAWKPVIHINDQFSGRVTFSITHNVHNSFYNMVYCLPVGGESLHGTPVGRLSVLPVGAHGCQEGMDHPFHSHAITTAEDVSRHSRHRWYILV